MLHIGGLPAQLAISGDSGGDFLSCLGFRIIA